ncbi:MAG: hypothetical protein VYB54_00505 [Pseudomonadota bacterium]|nr:hypothetical protein [Pseudomonadota bacterium]
MNVRGRSRVAILALLGLLVLVAPAAAARAAGPDMQVGIAIAGAVVHGALPDWLESGSLEDVRTVRRFDAPDRSVIAWFPDGQGPDNWTSEFVLLSRLDPAEAAPDIDTAVGVALYPYFRNTFDSDFDYMIVEATADWAIIVVYCAGTGSADQPPPGYGKDVGTIALIRVAVVNGRIVEVFQEWRGPRFIQALPDTWPVRKATLEAMVERFRTIRIAPAP